MSGDCDLCGSYDHVETGCPCLYANVTERLTYAGPHDACDRRITELEDEVATLRCVIRWANDEIKNEWGEPMAGRVAFDLDDECVAAVRRAVEETE